MAEEEQPVQETAPVQNGEVLGTEASEDSRRYRLNLWWINNRDRLKRILVFVVLGIEGVLLAFAAWGLADAYLLSFDRERLAVSEIAAFGQGDLNAYTRAHAPEPLAPSAVTVLSAGASRYDFYAPLSNPNQDWWAEFDYAFSSSAGDLNSERGFILPGEERPLVRFSIDSASAPRSAQLEISNVTWHRVDRHEVGMYEDWRDDRLGFAVTNVELLSEEVEVGKQPIGRIAFHIRNQTAFSYFEPTFLIALKRGNNVVGIARTTLGSLESEEDREVSVNWFGPLPAATGAEVIPEINIFDPESYQELEGTAPATGG